MGRRERPLRKGGRDETTDERASFRCMWQHRFRFPDGQYLQIKMNCFSNFTGQA